MFKRLFCFDIYQHKTVYRKDKGFIFSQYPVHSDYYQILECPKCGKEKTIKITFDEYKRLTKCH